MNRRLLLVTRLARIGGITASSRRADPLAEPTLVADTDGDGNCADWAALMVIAPVWTGHGELTLMGAYLPEYSLVGQYGGPRWTGCLR